MFHSNQAPHKFCIFIQCLMRELTNAYMNKSSVGYTYKVGAGDIYCPLSQHVPCWVPQIKDVLDPAKSKQLTKCPTVWDYMCEMSFLMYAWKHGPSLCAKPCKTWIYRSIDAGSTKMPSYTITPSYSNTMFIMSFSTDTVLKHEERKVNKFQILRILSLDCHVNQFQTLLM